MPCSRKTRTRHEQCCAKPRALCAERSRCATRRCHQGPAAADARGPYAGRWLPRQCGRAVVDHAVGDRMQFCVASRVRPRRERSRIPRAAEPAPVRSAWCGCLRVVGGGGPAGRFVQEASRDLGLLGEASGRSRRSFRTGTRRSSGSRRGRRGGRRSRRGASAPATMGTARSRLIHSGVGGARFRQPLSFDCRSTDRRRFRFPAAAAVRVARFGSLARCGLLRSWG